MSAKRYATPLSFRKRQEETRGPAPAITRREHTVLRRQRRELEEASQAVRAELESAMARRRMMERLIERLEDAERGRAALREQRVLDDSSVIRFAHLRRMRLAGRAGFDEDNRTYTAGDRRIRGGVTGATRD